MSNAQPTDLPDPMTPPQPAETAAEPPQPLTADSDTSAVETHAGEPALEDAKSGEANPTETISALEARVAELRDALLYAKAESDNQRRRAQEDVAAAHKYAVSKFASELLVVKDCLEMALKDNSSIENIKVGVEMTLRNLSNAFEKVQLREIEPKAGDKLDPNRHQAMNAIESDQEPNTVVSVMQKGYLLAERVLRPAMVVVSKARGQATPS